MHHNLLVFLLTNAFVLTLNRVGTLTTRFRTAQLVLKISQKLVTGGAKVASIILLLVTSMVVIVSASIYNTRTVIRHPSLLKSEMVNVMKYTTILNAVLMVMIAVPLKQRTAPILGKHQKIHASQNDLLHPTEICAILNLQIQV